MLECLVNNKTFTVARYCKYRNLYHIPNLKIILKAQGAFYLIRQENIVMFKESAGRNICAGILVKKIWIKPPGSYQELYPVS